MGGLIVAIASVTVTINGQDYPVSLDADGYYALSANAPALSSYHQPGGYYAATAAITDDAGNVTTVGADDPTWGEALRLLVAEITKPTASITYPSNDGRINTCTPVITAQLRDNDSGVDASALDLRINGGDRIGPEAAGMTLTKTDVGYDLSYSVPSALPEGQATITLGVSDHDGNATDPATVVCTIAVTAPTISLSSPIDGLVTNQAAVLVEGITSDDQLTSVTLTVTVNGVDQGPVTIDSTTGAFGVSARAADMQEGNNTIRVHVVDATGLEAEIIRTVKLDTRPPRITEIIGVTDRVNVGAPITIRIKAVDN